tara:strand:- start:7153 stop:7350 length:198 start_codon:yes stop_codon:yes gene_type:complete
MNIKWEQLEDIELENVWGWDAPDFVDAYILRAKIDGVELTDEEYEFVNDNFPAEIQEAAYEYHYM